jgi:hypothetical protein
MVGSGEVQVERIGWLCSSVGLRAASAPLIRAVATGILGTERGLTVLSDGDVESADAVMVLSRAPGTEWSLIRY